MKLFLKGVAAAALAAMVALAPGRAAAQNNLFAFWKVANAYTNYGFTINGSVTNELPLTNNFASPNVYVSTLNHGPALRAIPAGFTYFGGSGWTNAGVASSEANSITYGQYVTWQVKATPGFNVSFATNIYYIYKATGGPTTGILQYSSDGVTYTNVGNTLSYGTSATLYTNYLATNGLVNVPSTVTNYFRLVSWGASSATAAWAIENSASAGFAMQILGTIGSTGVAPSNVTLTPSAPTANAGSAVTFTVSAQGDPTTNLWYQVVGGVTNFLTITPNTYPGSAYSSLTLSNLTGGNAGTYFVVLTNASGTNTSPLATLTVTGDPGITTQPNSAFGLLNGTVSFSAVAVGTGLSYQWYHAAPDGTLASAVVNGTQPSGSTASGATTATLKLSNLQAADPTNFVLRVSGTYGQTNSAVATLSSVGTTAMVAFWDFNQVTFPSTLTSPAPWFGTGTTSISTNWVASSGSPDSADGPGTSFPAGLGTTNYSWAVATLNASFTNQNKVFFENYFFSTVGAKDLSLSLDARVSATASDFFRLQYTTNSGTNWVDYPTSSTFNYVGTTYRSFNYDLSFLPGAANNPYFGVRLTPEFASTATYGNNPTNAYVGTANNFGLTGTFTVDLVDFTGTALTNSYNQPSIALTTYKLNNGSPVSFNPGFTNTVTAVDTNIVTVNYTVSSPATPASQLTVSATSLYSQAMTPSVIAATGPDASGNGSISFQLFSAAGQYAAAPILLTVTDTNGDTSATWFTLAEMTYNLAPTNPLVRITLTNTLVGTPLTIPFTVTDDQTPVNGQSFSYAATTANGTLFSNVTVTASGAGNANAVLTITPAPGQQGVGAVSVTVYDNDPAEPKQTKVTFPVVVTPNTNVIADDYFTYDGAGSSLALDAQGYWQHLSGVTGQLKTGTGPDGNNVATVDTYDYTENVQIPLLGGTYATNSGFTLYASFSVNEDPSILPRNNGTYFALFNDGSGVTGPYEGRVIATTNGAANGFYRLGINNFGSDATSGQVFPQDLTPGQTYKVVVALALTNGNSTLWVNPSAANSVSVTDTTGNSTTNLYNIKAFELRESGTYGGSARVGYVKVGTSFDAVFPSLQIKTNGGNYVLTWSDPTLPLQVTTNLTQPFTILTNATSPYTLPALGNQAYYQLAP